METECTASVSPKACEGCFSGAQKCKQTRTRGRGHETESSQEVRHVLALVPSPYREGWGRLFMVSCRHPRPCWLCRRINRAAFMLDFDHVLNFSVRTRGLTRMAWHLLLLLWNNMLTKSCSSCFWLCSNNSQRYFMKKNAEIFEAGTLLKDKLGLWNTHCNNTKGLTVSLYHKYIMIRIKFMCKTT